MKEKSPRQKSLMSKKDEKKNPSLTGILRDITERKQSGKELEATELGFKTIFDSVSDGILLAQISNRKFTIANKKMCEMLGYTEKELLKLGVSDIHPKESLPYAIEQFEKFKRKEEVIAHDIPIMKKDRTISFADISGSVFTIQGEEYLLGIFRDITERKKTEKALRQEKDFSESLINTAQAIILVLDTEARIERFNFYMEEISGFRLEEVKGKNWFDIFLPEEDRGKIKKVFKQAINDLSTKGNINPIITKDGRKVFVEWWDKTLKDENGRTVGLIAIGHDVTKRMKAEEILYESESKFRKIFESSHEGIFLLDIKSKKFAICNQAFLDMLGYTEDELKTLNIQDIHPKEEIPFILKQIKLFEEGKPGVGKDTIFKKKDGSLCFADISPSFIELGWRKYILAICKDITEQKKMEEELRKDKLSLEQKNIALTELVEHMERTKNRVKEDIAINIEESIIPILEKHKLKGLPPKYLDVLRHHLNELTSSFGRMMSKRSARLSSREIEICNLIKGGITTKEISGLLNISSQTVDKHRKNIRKKLGISGKDKNLTTYLKSL